MRQTIAQTAEKHDEYAAKFAELRAKKGDLMAYGMDITVNDTDDGSPAVVIYRAKLSA